MSVESLFAQWRVVNEQANDAERRLFEAGLLHLRGDGPPPKETERVIAAQLRAEARALFVRALKAIDDGAPAARAGIIPAASRDKLSAQPGSE